MKPISAVLRELLRQPALAEGLANHAVFPRWSEVVGPHLAIATRPLRVQGKTLWIWVESSVLQHQLSLLTPMILDKIRAAAPGTTIDTIRFTMNPEP